MNNFDMENMKRMQQEAVRRVQEMHARAQQTVAGQQPNNEHLAKREKPKTPVASPIDGILDTLFKDGERLTILILIFLLIDEKADLGLILALIYMILDV